MSRVTVGSNESAMADGVTDSTVTPDRCPASTHSRRIETTVSRDPTLVMGSLRVVPSRARRMISRAAPPSRISTTCGSAGRASVQLVSEISTRTGTDEKVSRLLGSA
jgi:hypothetical protein